VSQSAVAYAAKLLKRADQCRAAVATSHIWWQDDPAPPARSPAAAAASQPPVRDAAKVMAGLKRALKAVGAAKQQRAAAGPGARPLGGGGGGSGSLKGGGGGGAGAHLGLYVDIANHYLYYFERGVPEMSPSVVSQVGAWAPGRARPCMQRVTADGWPASVGRRARLPALHAPPLTAAHLCVTALSSSCWSSSPRSSLMQRRSTLRWPPTGRPPSATSHTKRPWRRQAQAAAATAAAARAAAAAAATARSTCDVQNLCMAPACCNCE
jgi:hypothetical protein